jgi:hypothetical protein
LSSRLPLNSRHVPSCLLTSLNRDKTVRWQWGRLTFLWTQS